MAIIICITGDYGNGRSGASGGSKYNTSSLDRSSYTPIGRPLHRSSSITGSRSSVDRQTDRYTTNSLSRATGGYASDYGGSNMSISSSYGAGYNSRYA